MPALNVAALVLVAISGTAVLVTRDPLAQALMVSGYGLALVVLFVVFEAPDVALSQIVVGAVAIPLMILLALAKAHKDREEARQR